MASSSSSITKLLLLLTTITTTTLASLTLPPVFPTYARPRCITPPDLHPVSQVVPVCTTLLSDFISNHSLPSYHWTSNASLTGPAVIHLPHTEFRVNANETQACLIEILDYAADVTEDFAASNVLEPAKAVLKECFARDKCGLVPLPPRYVTDLFVCGTTRRPRVNVTLERAGAGVGGGLDLVLSEKR